MEQAEYMAFIPLLIYGMGIADLFGSFKRISFDFWPYMFMALILAEAGIYNVFLFFQVIHHMTDITYWEYLINILQPLLYLAMAITLTPDKLEDTKEAFERNRKKIFLLAAAFILIHFLHDYNENIGVYIGRIVISALCVLIAFTKSYWTFYVLVVLYTAGLIARFLTMAA